MKKSIKLLVLGSWLNLEDVEKLEKIEKDLLENQTYLSFDKNSNLITTRTVENIKSTIGISGFLLAIKIGNNEIVETICNKLNDSKEEVIVGMLNIGMKLAAANDNTHAMMYLIRAGGVLNDPILAKLAVENNCLSTLKFIIKNSNIKLNLPQLMENCMDFNIWMFLKSLK